MNDAVAVVGSTARVLDTAEEALGKEVSMAEAAAIAVQIANDDDYVTAGEIVKEVKGVQKKVTEYWEPLRQAAKTTYDSVLGRKKEMLSPLESAEKILKGKMGSYTMEKERQRKAREEAMREQARLEMEKKLAEAAEADAAGDSLTAEFAMAEAEVMDDVAHSAIVNVSSPKANGVSTRKSWKITRIDEKVVPAEIAGAVIRPVDEKAVMALIKATKGTIKIPGIEYEENVEISVRI